MDSTVQGRRCEEARGLETKALVDEHFIAQRALLAIFAHRGDRVEEVRFTDVVEGRRGGGRSQVPRRHAGEPGIDVVDLEIGTQYGIPLQQHARRRVRITAGNEPVREVHRPFDRRLNNPVACDCDDQAGQKNEGTGHGQLVVEGSSHPTRTWRAFPRVRPKYLRDNALRASSMRCSVSSWEDSRWVAMTVNDPRVAFTVGRFAGRS